MPTAIVTLEEFAAALPTELGSADTDELQRILDAAAADCQRFTSRLFAPEPPFDVDGNDTGAPITRHFAVRGRKTIRIPDLRVAIAVTLDGVTLTPNLAYRMDLFAGMTATEISLISNSVFVSSSSAGDLAITGRWGMLEAPEEIKDSIIEHAARKLRKKDARWSDTVTVGTGQFTYFRGRSQDVTDVWNMYRVPNFGVIA